MGIFSRFNRVLKSNLNSMLDKAEDPAKLIDQTVVEMEAELKNAKKELITTLGTAKRLEKKAKTLAEDLSGWERKAILALESGDESLAREALKMKLKVQRQADAAEQQSSEQHAAAGKMQDTLDEIERKVEDLKARKSTLAAQVRRSREDPNEGYGSSAGAGAFGDLERLSGRIESLESEVEAHDVLDDPSTRDLDARFRALERRSGDTRVDDELAALKDRLGD